MTGRSLLRLRPPRQKWPAVRWHGGAFEQVEDHRGQTVYGGADGRQPITIHALGPKSDFGTDAPAPLSPEEQEAEQEAALQAAQAQKIEAARAELYARQESSFFHQGRRVKAGERDLEAMARFGGLIDGLIEGSVEGLVEGAAEPWPETRRWFAIEPAVRVPAHASLTRA